MHSRIFGIVRKDNEKYEEEKNTILDYTEDEIYENCETWADYIGEETNLKDDFDWLTSKENLFKKTGETTFKICKKDIKDYFKEKINKIRYKINEIDTVEDFFKDKYILGQMVDRDTGFKFMYCSFDIENIDDFLEFTYFDLKDKEEMEFEIVKTWDYHF